MLTAISLDDEPMALEIIQHYSARMPDEIKLEATFTSILEAKEYLENNKIDLIFLDVRMPMLSGIDFYKMFGKNSLLVLTTAYADYALEGFKLDAVDYLLKPFDFGHFEKAVLKAKSMLRTQSLLPDDLGQIFLKVDGQQAKIRKADIVYVEGMGDYLKVFLGNGRFVVTRLTMKAMENQLSSGFLRIHKSFIVAGSQITGFSTKEIQLGVKTIPVGDSYSKSTMAHLLAQKNKKT